MSALVRYLLASFARSQRWVAPVLVYLVLLAILVPAGGPPLSLVAGAAATLFPLGAWMTYLVVGDEDAVQEAITATSAGSLARVRQAKFASAALVTGVLGLLSVLIAVVRAWPGGPRAVASVAGAGTAAVLANAVAGAALGLLCVKPLVPHRGWSVLGIVAVSLGALLVPGLPPLRATLEAFNHDAGLLVPVVLTAVSGVAAALVMVIAAVTLTVRRF